MTESRELRNRDAIETGRLDLPDYDDLFDGCAKCGFTDMDAIAERNGLFLVVEMKKPTESVTIGQKILLKNMAKIKEFTVIVRWGTRGNTKAIWIPHVLKRPVVCTEDEFRAIIKQWWTDANQRRNFDPVAFYKSRYAKMATPPLPKQQKPV